MLTGPVDEHAEARLAPPSEMVLLLHLSVILLSIAADGKHQEESARIAVLFIVEPHMQ